MNWSTPCFASSTRRPASSASPPDRSMSITITTPRFTLRELTVDDVTPRYLGWFAHPDAVRFIVAAARTRQLADLRSFVEERSGRDDVLFLGIFARDTGLHLGNIKYEPVDSVRGYAV